MIEMLKDAWWLIGVLIIIFTALWRLAIRTNKDKERLEQVCENKKTIDALKSEMGEMKDDVADIKTNQAKQGSDIAAILMGVQSMMASLSDKGCDIGPARDKLNEYLAKR